MKKYEVYGDYALATECLLEEFDTYAEAERWVDGYTARGDFGGYETIEVITFAEDGEAITHYIVGVQDLYEDEEEYLLDEY